MENLLFLVVPILKHIRVCHTTYGYVKEMMLNDEMKVTQNKLIHLSKQNQTFLIWIKLSSDNEKSFQFCLKSISLRFCNDASSQVSW